MSIELTADQWFEVEMAVLWGSLQATRNAMSDDERARATEAKQAHIQRMLSDPNLSEDQRADLAEAAALEALPLEEKERRFREDHYSQPQGKRDRLISELRTNAYSSLTSSKYFSQEQRDAIDERLAARSLPSLRQLEIASKQYHKRILKRGRIASEEEWRIVHDLLEFTSPVFGLTKSDRLKLESISAEYEKSIKDDQ